jgi:hypothetical protein
VVVSAGGGKRAIEGCVHLAGRAAELVTRLHDALAVLRRPLAPLLHHQLED